GTARGRPLRSELTRLGTHYFTAFCAQSRVWRTLTANGHSATIGAGLRRRLMRLTHQDCPYNQARPGRRRQGQTPDQESQVSQDQERPENLVWATRGRSWGFRFLLNGGLSDPLPTYERIFAHSANEPTTWCRD